jgi:hypothetical protein
MADSISHSVFIVVAQRGINCNAHINQRAEHSSPYGENLRRGHVWDPIDELYPAPWLVFPIRVRTVYSMNKTVIEVQVRAVLPTSGGCAVFIGNNDKVFIIYVDQTVGSAITMFMRHITKERPLTHDLMAHLLAALGAKIERVIINDLKNATYYARVIIQVENEVRRTTERLHRHGHPTKGTHLRESGGVG